MAVHTTPGLRWLGSYRFDGGQHRREGFTSQSNPRRIWDYRRYQGKVGGRLQRSRLVRGPSGIRRQRQRRSCELHLCSVFPCCWFMRLMSALASRCSHLTWDWTDGIGQYGGIHYKVPAGRKDGTVSKEGDTSILPSPALDLTELTKLFISKGLSQNDMITLSGNN